MGSGPEAIRNIVVVADGAADKTAVIESLLFQAKAISKRGAADKGEQVVLIEPEEIERRTTIASHPVYCNWEDTHINLIDCPGYFNFLESTRSILPGIDGAVLVISAAHGIGPEAQRLWGMLVEANVPVLGLVTQLEEEQADLSKVLAGVQSMLDVPVAALNLPIGAGARLSGIVDLLSQTAWSYNDGKASKAEPPVEMAAIIEESRGMLVERLAEAEDVLIEKFLEGEEISTDELNRALRESLFSRNFLPVLVGSASQLIGIDCLLSALVAYLPDPVERTVTRPIVGKEENGAEQLREGTETEPFAALVLKTTIDPFSGKLSVVRVFSGKVKTGDALYNSSRGSKEKAGHVYRLQGKELESVDVLSAGEIGAIAKLDSTHTTDTLCDPQSSIILPKVEFFKPQVMYAVVPEGAGDEKVSAGLAKLAEEDPTIRVERNAETGELILSGMGQAHIEVTLQRLERKFGGKAKLVVPQVPYRETVRKKVSMEGKLKKQSGGHGQFARCVLEIEPLPRDQGFEFADMITGGIVPKQYIPSVEKGVIEAMKAGTLGGYPVVDVKVSLVDGQFHAVDSSDYAFQVAGSMGFKAGSEQAQPVLLEPIMTLTVILPEEFTGDVMKDISSRRGRVLGMETERGQQVIRAEVPLSEVLEYGAALGAITSGRGLFQMELTSYSEVPDQISEKVLELRRKQLEADKE